MIYTVANILIPLFSIVAAGYGYGRWRGPNMQVVNQLSMEVFLPMLVFSVLASADFALFDYLPLAAGATLVVLGSGLLLWPLCRPLGFEPRVFLPPMMFSNSGNLGLPLAVFAYGEGALPAMMVMFLAGNTLHFTLGIYIVNTAARPLAILREPIMVATIAGLTVSFSGLVLPVVLTRGVELFAQIAVPLMLFSLGVRLTAISTRGWRAGLVGAIACPAAGLAIAVTFSHLLGLDREQAGLLYIFAALPPAVLNYLLAERYGLRPELAASMILFGHVGTVLVLPAVLAYSLS